MKKEWFETWFDSPYYHLLYRKHDQADAERSLDNLLTTVQLAPGARILDLACGRGRHACRLSHLGFDVTGLDLSEQNIAYARRMESERLEFFVHDMRKPFRSNYFDAVFNMFTSFGYFRSEQEHLAVLKQVWCNLRPQGWFLLDFFNSNRVKQQLSPSEERNIDGVYFHIRRRLEGDRVFKSIQVDTGKEQYIFSESVRLFSLEDFERMFAVAGLQLRQVFGGYDLASYLPDLSDRLILVAQKMPNP